MGGQKTLTLFPDIGLNSRKRVLEAPDRQAAFFGYAGHRGPDHPHGIERRDQKVIVVGQSDVLCSGALHRAQEPGPFRSEVGQMHVAPEEGGQTPSRVQINKVMVLPVAACG